MSSLPSHPVAGVGARVARAVGPPPMTQLALPVGLHPEPTLASYVVGDNAMALDQIAAWDGVVPLYLWGPTGAGKTHLLRALLGERRWRGTPVAWFEAGAPLPWHVPDAVRLLVLDRCDALDAAAQQAAFALFVAATAEGVPVAAAGRLPPVDLPLRDDLRTRLAGGHVVGLQPLSDSDLRQALAHAASERGLALPDELTQWLMTRQARDLQHLVALLDRLDAYALAHRRGLSLPLLRQMLADDPVGSLPPREVVA